MSYNLCIVVSMLHIMCVGSYIICSTHIGDVHTYVS
jgi:hypothetical protein